MCVAHLHTRARAHTHTHTHKQTKLLPNPQNNSYTYVRAHTCTHWSIAGTHTCMEPRRTKTWNCWTCTHKKDNFIAKWPSTHEEYILKRQQRKTGTNARFTTLHHNNGKRECRGWGSQVSFWKRKYTRVLSLDLISAFPWTMVPQTQQFQLLCTVSALLSRVQSPWCGEMYRLSTT